MKRQNAYLLPENPSPDGYRCLVVWIPDEDAYFRAVTGSLMHLEKWVAWERDEAHTALLAASRMRTANQITLEKMQYVDCEFLQELLEDNDMSINITNNTSCGGCSGGCGTCPSTPPIGPLPEENMPPPQATEDIANLPGGANDPGGEQTPPGFDSREQYELYKCRAARALARDVIDTVSNLSTLSGIVGAGGAILLAGVLESSALLASLAAPLVIAGLTAGGGLAAVAVVIAVLVMAAGVGTIMFGYFELLSQQLELEIDEMTCDFYCASSADEARQSLIDRTTVSIGNLIYEDAGHESIFTEVIFKVFQFFLPSKYFNLLFNTTEAVDEYLEGRDENFDCGSCECEDETVPEAFFIKAASFTCPDPLPQRVSLCDSSTEYVQHNYTTADGNDSMLAGTITHDEPLFWAVIMEPSWNVGTWRNDRIGSQVGGSTWVNGGVFVYTAGNLSATNIAIVKAWADENGYTTISRGQTAFTTGDAIPITHRLALPAGEISNLIIRYRFAIPNP